MGDTVRRLTCAAVALGAACRASAPATPTQAGPSCRDVARRAELVIGRSPDRTRDDATRFFAEVIDLCQEPGLAQRARTCLAQANDLADAHACPSLPATADTFASPRDGASPPSCRTVVAHAMRVLASEAAAPVSATDRADEEQIYLRDCTAASTDGRRCAAVALTTDAIDECLALRDDDEDDDDDDPDPDPAPDAPD
ncbi:MAG TPA: hypothetical protein VM261_10895 [Kofleriaceae bacterium]|nr:hypothetical protein [Kofleriaceae bacterium]